MARPRLLDLFCGQGGAGWGYHLAGFDVTGVDVRPMPLHPPQMEFIQADALEYVRERGHEYDAIHASPVCRAHTRARGAATGRYRHADYIPGLRKAFGEMRARGLRTPYVIENVVGAPLVDPVVLCGAMFGLPMYRHRLIEFGNIERPEPPAHPEHTAPVASMGRKPREGEYWSIAGNFSGVWEAGDAMGMPWANQDGLRQAVPPAYTWWVGSYLMHVLHSQWPTSAAKVEA
jgi:DNA (cytosine-5)-methyltransferase 1